MGKEITSEIFDFDHNNLPRMSQRVRYSESDDHKDCQSIVSFKNILSNKDLIRIDNERKYRNCLINSKDEWYNSEHLKIISEKNINIEEKSAKFKVTVINKSARDSIHIEEFEVSDYDANGISTYNSRIEN